MKKTALISKISIVIIFLALVRSIGEPLRLEYENGTVSYPEAKPFLLAAMLCAVGMFGMVFSYYFKKYLLTIALAVIIISGMVYLKIHYNI